MSLSLNNTHREAMEGKMSIFRRVTAMILSSLLLFTLTACSTSARSASADVYSEWTYEDGTDFYDLISRKLDELGTIFDRISTYVASNLDGAKSLKEVHKSETYKELNRSLNEWAYGAEHIGEENFTEPYVSECCDVLSNMSVEIKDFAQNYPDWVLSQQGQKITDASSMLASDMGQLKDYAAKANTKSLYVGYEFGKDNAYHAIFKGATYSQRVEPSNKDRGYLYYSVNDTVNDTFLILTFEYTNLRSEAYKGDASDNISASAKYMNQYNYESSTFVETNGGSSVSHSFSLDPLATCLVYIAIEIPESMQSESADVNITFNGQLFTFTV